MKTANEFAAPGCLRHPPAVRESSTFVDAVSAKADNSPLAGLWLRFQSPAQKVRLFSGVLFLFFFAQSARAQLATSFLNVTKIETKVLVNAIQITIRTDGTPQFGTDLIDWFDFSNGVYSTKATTHFRLRVLNARAKVPSYVQIGVYPLDALLVTPGREAIVNPYFPYGQAPETDPHVDIELRFAVPIQVRRLSLGNGQNTYFSDTLDAREVGVEPGSDRQSIVITIVPDRSDTNGAARLPRSPREGQKHSLKIERAGSVNGVPRFSIHALHQPLPELLSALAREAKIPFADSAGAADVDISLVLPIVTLAEFGRTLEIGYGLTVTREGEGFAVTRGGDTFERIALNHLSPQSARVLFPDFLLPSLRADSEGSALWISASPRVAARVRRDLQTLDVPRKQIRVEAQMWEVSSNDEISRALRLALGGGSGTFSLDSTPSTAILNLRKVDKPGLQIGIAALERKGAAKLVARPFAVVLSGANASLSLGQTRYVSVQRNDLSVQALQLQIGYTLEVTPVAGSNGEITIDLNARASTVDSLEPETRLPTLGIRQAQGASRVRSGDTILIAGLDSDLQSQSRDGIFPSRRQSREKKFLLVFLTATIL